jgi:hypothetical protein
MEPSGIYDTQILIQDVQKKFIIPYHTKYKRIKKNTKKDRRIDVEEKEDKDEMDEDDDGDSGPEEKDGQERYDSTGLRTVSIFFSHTPGSFTNGSEWILKLIGSVSLHLSSPTIWRFLSFTKIRMSQPNMR